MPFKSVCGFGMYTKLFLLLLYKCGIIWKKYESNTAISEPDCIITAKCSAANKLCKQ